MPCTSDWPCDTGPSKAQIEADKKARRLNAIGEATLCGLLTNLSKYAEGKTLEEVLTEMHLDWKEMNVTFVEVQEWWTDHQKKDAIRRKREDRERKVRNAERARKKLRREALAALTPEQRKALGFK